MALVLALGVLGVSYAMWFDTIFVTTKVYTGSVNVDILNQKSNDPGPWVEPYYVGTEVDESGNVNGLGDPAWPHSPGSEVGAFWWWDDISDPATWVWEGPKYDKNVAYADCLISGDTITYTVNNAYPSYGPDVAFTVKNNGTIPVHLQAKITSVTTPSGTFTTNQIVTPNYVYSVDQSGNIAVDVTDREPYEFSVVMSAVGGAPYSSVQLEPGDITLFDTGIHLEQSANQGGFYSFTVEFLFHQWNEAP